MSKNNKKNLQKLIAEWDRKLKDSGFVDIEDRRTGLLKKCGGDVLLEPSIFKKSGNWVEHETALEINFEGRGYSTFVWKQSQAEYYRIASIMCHEGEFKSDREKEIWNCHAEGMSSREIAKRTNLTQRQVFYTIQNIEKRFWLLKNDK